MTERRTYRSSPDWKTLDGFARAIAALTNPQAHFWTADQGGENGTYGATPEPERKAGVEEIKAKMQKYMDTPLKPEDGAGSN